MKKFRVFMGVLALTVVVGTIFGCKKGNEVNVVSNEQDDRKPIAVYDNNSRVITTLVDVEALNTIFNEPSLANKELTNRFVAESIEVLDSMPRNKNVRGEIKITLLDTEEECSYSVWCMNSYVVKDVKEQRVDYYLDENVANGNYNIAFKNEDIYYVANIVGDSLSSIHEVDPLDYACVPWVLFTCRSVDCTNQCDKQGTFLHASCKPCPFPDGECNEEGTLPTIITLIVIVVRVALFFI